MDEPLTWHYGLMAERWFEFIRDTPEMGWLAAAIARHGEPVLDVGCGAGRLLVPLRAAGVDVDGADLSADMLAQTQRRADAEGLRVALYARPMHALDVPRRYRTVYIAGSFGLAGSRANDLETLRRCRAHLEPGGALLFNIQAEYATAAMWALWGPERRAGLPEPWPGRGEPAIAADGSAHYAEFRILEVDPLEQTLLRQVRLEKWRDGAPLAREEYTLRDNMYLMHEVRLMLAVAGFRDVAVTGDWTDAPATPESREIVFTAIA
jgi:SAM-dependent methyltransferase